MAIIIDTGVFYAFYNRRDIHHLDSICIIYHALKGKWGLPLTTVLVVSETYTLLRRRLSYTTAQAFLKALEESGIKILFPDEALHQEAKRLLTKYHDVELSYTDAATAALLHGLNIKCLATFDERSFTPLAPVIIGKGYSKTLSKRELQEIKDKASIR